MIRIKDINKTYKNGLVNVNALKNISLNVKDGEFISIMGASGSGKSTLMNILGCLDKPSSGEYYLDNCLVSSQSDIELSKIRNSKIGFVFQSFNLLPKLTAKKNVELPMIYAGTQISKISERVVEVLKIVNLEERMTHKPSEMSGGQKQRVAVARSLVNNPSIILADEPTGNLDSKASEEIMKLFQKLNRHGTTIILVTHETEIASYTKRKIVFKDGEIISDSNE